jgi:hypothetical protein
MNNQPNLSKIPYESARVRILSVIDPIVFVLLNWICEIGLNTCQLYIYIMYILILPKIFIS